MGKKQDGWSGNLDQIWTKLETIKKHIRRTSDKNSRKALRKQPRKIEGAVKKVTGLTTKEKAKRKPNTLKTGR